MNIKKRFSKLLAAILTIILMLTLIPGGLIMPQTVSADSDILDLSNVPSGVGDVYTYDRFMVDTTENIIVVVGSDPVTITGDGSIGGWSVIACGDVTIANGTTIVNAIDYALVVENSNAVVTGQGTNISISGIVLRGNITIAGTFGNISTDENYGIYGRVGNTTISGTIGNITGSERGIHADNDIIITETGQVGNITGNRSHGVHADGNVTIEGTVGNITGPIYGIYAGGDITITDTGEVGDITGRTLAIGDITISGTVGDIENANGHGISANGNVTIEPSGKTGNITASSDGIASDGNITIKGTIGNITSAFGISTNNGDITITETGTVGDITGGRGIHNYNGFVSIEGTVRNINAELTGIAGDGVHISGTVGDIASNSSYGIGSETGNVTVTGTVGNVSSAQDYGIYSRTGSIAIAGSVTAAGAYGAFNKAPLITAGASVEYSTNPDGTSAVTVSADSYIWDSSHRYIKTAATSITVVTITGLSITDSAYSGSPHPGYTGSPIFTGGSPTNPTLTVLYSSADPMGNYSSNTPPTAPGNYRVTVTLANDPVYFGLWTDVFNIEGTPGNTTYSVTSTADDGSPGTLRWAITQLNAGSGGDTINIAAELTGETITLTSDLSYINRNVTINGNGITISGGDQYSMFLIEYADVAFNRINFANGNFHSANGGAIFNIGGNLTVTNCVFKDNQTSGIGGAVFSMHNGTTTTATFVNCLFTGNTAGSGGAVGFDDGDGDGITFVNCTFTDDNTATTEGNIFYYYKDGSGTDPQFLNCIIANAPTGSIFAGSGALTIDNVIFKNTLTNAASLGSNTANANNKLNAADLGINADGTLAQGSPAIDAGNNSFNTAATDLAGSPRIQNGTIDMGAYEYYYALPNNILLPETKVSELILKYGAGTTAINRRNEALNSGDFVGTGAVITLPDGSKLTIIVYGDLIGDGYVLTDSIVALARHIAGFENLDGDAALLEAANVNGDGRINIADLIRLARYTAKIDTSNLGGF